MSSKDIKPKVRIGRHGLTGKKKAILWVVALTGLAFYFFTYALPDLKEWMKR